MKKLLAALLALIMVFTLAACGGKAGDGGSGSGGGSGEGSGSGGAAQAPETTLPSSKTAALFEEIFLGGEYTMVYEADEFEGPVTCVYSGDNMYISMRSEGQGVIVIKNADGTVMLLPDLKMSMSIGSDEEAGVDGLQEIMEDYSENMEFTTGTMDIDGKSYDYEEFKYEDGDCRYCYDGNELKYLISSVGTANEFALKVVELKKGADKSLFVVPDGYTSMN